MSTSPFPWSEGESFVFDASGQAICREYSHNLNWKDDRALIAAIPAMVAALDLQEAAEEAHANCEECGGDDVPELCPVCFPLYDDARIARRAVLQRVKK